MALYFYRNLLTNALVYSDQPAPPEGNRNMELIGEQTNMAPSSESDWVFDSLRSTFASVEKDDRVSGKISGLTSMGNIFYNCSALTTLDLSGFDTSQVTNMYSMFYNCSSLTCLDLSGFDTSQVTDMSAMFNGCSALRLLAISGSMSNVLSRLPADQYYPASGGDPVAKASLTAGTWVRDEADLSLVATLVETAQAAMALRRKLTSLAKRVAKLESGA